YYIVQGLSQNGVQVKVLTTNANGKDNLDIPPGKSVLVGGVPTEYHPLSPFPTRRYFYSTSLKKAINKHIHSFDIVHIQGTFTYPTLVAARLAWLAGKPFIISPRGGWDPWSLRQKWFKKKVYLELLEMRWINRASAIHYTTVAERELATKLGLKPHSFVIPNAIWLDPLDSKDAPMAFRKRWNIPLDAPVVLFLSRIHPMKGLDILLPAFARLHQTLPEAYLIIAGPDSEGFRARYKKMVFDFKLNQRIIWTGLVSGSEKTACYHAADIFVLPSYRENFGLVVAEAMFCHLPVLIAPGVNLADLVHRHQAGEVISQDVGTWALKIEEWLQDRSRCKSAGQKGYKVASKNFSIEAVGKAMFTRYERILASYKKAFSSSYS
ncbi:MAG: glycosyltransferase, partial [Anaerolineales bacterium]|nr:glycosyltransferase [Anaerolineales bacterium]